MNSSHRTPSRSYQSGNGAEHRFAGDQSLLFGEIHPADDLVGTPGNDRLAGTAGDDNFDVSQGGNDSVTALGGDDYIYMGGAFTAQDKLDGGDGDDQLELDGDYSQGLTLVGSSLRNIEQVFVDGGHSYALTLNNGNVAKGGLLSFFTLQFGASDSLKVDGSAVLDGDLALRGGAGNDVLIGGSGNDYFRSGVGTDVIDGGGGYNRISYANAPAGLTLDFNQQGHAQSTGLGTLTMSNVEDVSGTVFADIITGDKFDNYIAGGGGADTLTGNGGNDWFALGPDPSGNIPTGVSISGGSGVDLVDFYDNGLNTAGVTLDLSAAGAQVTGQGTVTMSSIEDATGTVFSDHITGTSGANHLYGNGGGDVLDGGAGNDTLDGDGYLFEGDPTGTDGPKTRFDADAPGDDTLIGGAGNDKMTGGAGADIFYFEGKSGKDQVTDFAAGTDKIQINVKSVHGFSDVAIADDGHGGSKVSWKGGSVDLQHVAPGSLGAGDFTFGKLSATAFAHGTAPADTMLESHHFSAIDPLAAAHCWIA